MLIAAALRGELDQARAARVYELGREATVVFTLALSSRLAKVGRVIAVGRCEARSTHAFGRNPAVCKGRHRQEAPRGP